MQESALRLESAIQNFLQHQPAAADGSGEALSRTLPPRPPGPRGVSLVERQIPNLPTITDLAYERARLAALDRYQVLDTEPERDFDEITELAAFVCGTDMALITLVEVDRQWMKAKLGVDICSTDREVAFCDYAVQSRSSLVVPDATKDPRFARNPFVNGVSGSIRFYAGAPLLTPDGYVLGTLCVLGTEPRTLSDHQLRMLEALAHQAMTQLEQRRQAEALAEEVARHEIARTALTRRKQFDEAVMEAVSAGVVACDANGDVVLRNAVQRRLTGMGPNESIGQDRFHQLRQIHYADGRALPDGQTPLRLAMDGRELNDVAMRIEQADGALLDVLVTARRIVSPEGEPLGAVAAFADITGERQVQSQLRASAAFHDAVLTASPDVIYTSDPVTGTMLWSSRNLTDMLGYTAEDLLALGDRVFDELVHPDDVERLRVANEAARELADGAVLMQRYRIKHADGDFRWLSRRITPFARDGEGLVTEVLGVARDVTDVVGVEERLREAALHDALTGLPNRTLLTDRLSNALARCGRSHAEVAVLFCDLDGFKSVNDSGGHDIGDQVLRETAERLTSSVRTQDTVARIGGDEFVVILEPAPQRETDADGSGGFDVRRVAAAVAERITSAVALPIDIGGLSYTVTSSIGITFADDRCDPAEVLRNADTAMYRAKSLGKNRAEVYGDASSC
jgi:diguanylate cyclase (GGDEF)-like protein/PAS domain S-box-containing protein